MKINPKEFNSAPFKKVKATVIAILVKDNKVLLSKRNIMPEKNKWSMPGGHIEIGETAVHAIRREMKEETNLSIKNLKFLRYFDEIVPRSKIHAICLIFTGKGKGKIKLNKENTKIKYFSKKEIKNRSLAFYHKKILLEFFKTREWITPTKGQDINK